MKITLNEQSMTSFSQITPSTRTSPFSSQNIGNFGMQEHAWVCAVSFQFRMWMRMSEQMWAGGLNGQSNAVNREQSLNEDVLSD